MAAVVPDWLRQRASLSPTRPSLTDSETWTFAHLDRRVDAACAALARRGIQPGQRVGLHAPNSRGFVVAVFALMRLGAVLVPINTRLSASEIEWQRQDAELSVVLDDSDVAALLAAGDGTSAARDFDLQGLHSIVYTSGTTGRPKGALLSYGNHWWSAIGSALNLGLHANDCWLACLPLFHVGGLAIVLRSVIYGTAAVIHHRFDAAVVNQAIDEQGVTIVSVVSTMLDRMLAERGQRAYPASLRAVLLGGGPAPRPLLERALDLDVPLIQTYGLTEAASQVATLAPAEARRKVGSAGKPLLGTRLRIADDGEILVDGPTVSGGYLHHPPRTGWLSTGDLGYLDDDGYLFVLDRREDLIVSGGENVYPAEVEAALLAHPLVEDAGVFGLADAEWGLVPAAVVKTRAPIQVEELVRFCRARIAGYKVPRRVTFADALPRNAAGKLLRRELAELASAAPRRQ
ncbi:MAG: o-succinylbenzoate--CoA ligase [Chloroflexota bacterium]|nr:o-succinylbenzoate--CoA ligase [Chloroflexota bacterium]